MFVTGELLIFSLGEYHKVAVSYVHISSHLIMIVG